MYSTIRSTQSCLLCPLYFSTLSVVVFLLCWFCYFGFICVDGAVYLGDFDCGQSHGQSLQYGAKQHYRQFWLVVYCGGECLHCIFASTLASDVLVKFASVKSLISSRKN